MAFNNRIWVNHATYTSPKILKRYIAKRTTHMQLKFRINALPEGDVCNAIKEITTKDKEQREKASVIIVFSVGPKDWTVRVSLPEYMYLTDAFIDSDPLEAVFMGSALCRKPEQVVSKGFILSKDEAEDILDKCSNAEALAFNAAETKTKRYKRS